MLIVSYILFQRFQLYKMDFTEMLRIVTDITNNYALSPLNITIPTMAINMPTIFFIDRGCFSMPKIPSNSIR